MSDILLIGPMWGNAAHGAEPGIYDALVELGHNVSVWDHRVQRYRIAGSNDLNAIELDTENADIFSDLEKQEIVLAPGPGQIPEILNSKMFKATQGALRIMWNSEPIRLGNYKARVENNKKHFQMFATFDESEIPLYKQLGIDAFWLPQAYNPKWYHPIKLPKSQRFPEHLCFIGSVGGKWANRMHLLNRVRQAGIKFHATTIFDAKKVNHAYNMHDAVLNLGLYCPESGNPEDLKAFGLQQRIFESIGAGRVCITNEIPDGTNRLFEHNKQILYYNKDNFEDILRLSLDNRNRKEMETHIADIRNSHTYKARMESLIDRISWEN